MRTVICGAGIAGLALAQRLASDSWGVTVVEAAPGPRTQEWFLPSSRTRLRLRRIIMKLTAVPGLDRYFRNALVGKARVSIEELSGERQCLSRLAPARR